MNVYAYTPNHPDVERLLNDGEIVRAPTVEPMACRECGHIQYEGDKLFGGLCRDCLWEHAEEMAMNEPEKLADALGLEVVHIREGLDAQAV